MTALGAQEEARERTTLALEGMTCASCAARIERSLNKLEGVEATVNYATETASVTYDPAVVAPESLVAAVERVGYHVRPADHVHEHDAAPTRLIVAIALSIPLALLAMIPPLQFAGWEGVSRRARARARARPPRRRGSRPSRPRPGALPAPRAPGRS